jgi:tetratricopeptide (TPR) repeat protein
MRIAASAVRSLPAWLRGFVALAAFASLAASSAQAQTILQPGTEHFHSPLVAQGYALLEEGASIDALDHFKRALEANAEDVSARLGKAMTLATLERHEEAFANYDSIVETYPRHAFAWNGRGLAAFNLEDFDTALRSFQRATAEQPVNGFFYESLAWTQMCRGDYGDAVRSARTATMMYQRSSEASLYPFLIAYFAHLEQGEHDRARATLGYAAGQRSSGEWPGPVIDYLRGAMSDAELISYVRDSAQETEAHTYIGLNYRHRDDMVRAKRHLDWVARYGDRRVFETALARSIRLQPGVARLQHQGI